MSMLESRLDWVSCDLKERTMPKAYDDVKDHEKAFEYYMEGCRLKRLTYEYSAADAAANFQKTMEIFDPAFFAMHKGIGLDSDLPIFILGMPRSY